MATDTDTLLKVQHKKFHLNPLTMGSGRGRQSGIELQEGTLGFVVLGRELIPKTPSFLGRALPSMRHQSGAKQ